MPQADGSFILPRRTVCAGFVDGAEGFRRDGRVVAFFWQCKEPGLRLRLHLHGGSDTEAVRLDMAARLRRLRRAGVVGRWWTSVYEPEVHLFGGAAASEAFHHHATVDSWILARWGREQMPYSDAVLSLAALNDLFQRALGARQEEVWDVWCRLAQMHGRPPAAGPGLPPVTLSALAEASARRPAGRLLRRLMRANETLAGRLDRLWQQGKLNCGQRASLSCIALFHWNRLALPAETRVRLLDGMTARLNIHSPAGA